MVEANTNPPPEQNASPAQSKVAYEAYREQVFAQLEQEQNPLLVDTEAAELLLLVLRHPEFTPADRLKEFIFVAQLTMSRLCSYTKDPQQAVGVIRQAKMIHQTYGRVFAQSMIELAKLPAPVLPP